MMTETDVAYIAGLFDGEGCITYKQYMRKKKTPKESISYLEYKNGNGHDR